MGFIRRIAGILGILRGDAHGANDGDEEGEDLTGKDVPRRPTKGFSVQVPVAVERSNLGPILAPCNLGEGGVQGFKWYGKRLRIDEDGDVAEEFLHEVSSSKAFNTEAQTVLPKFEVKSSTQPVTVKNQIIAVDGNVHQSVEYRGRLQWV